MATTLPTWASSDTNIATVDALGLVTLKNPGIATITASNASVTSNAATVKVKGFNGSFGVSREDNCAIDDSGTGIYCWGDGYPITGNVPIPLQLSYPNPLQLLLGQIPAGTGIAQVSPGFKASCALTSAGAAYCWKGAFDNSEIAKLGTGSALPASQPALVLQGELPLGEKYIKLSASAGGSLCALASDGNVYCWGDRPRAVAAVPQPGSGFYAAPVRLARGNIPLTEKIVDFEVTINNICMLSSSGRAYCGGSQNVPAVLPFGEVPANTKLVKLSKDGGAGSVFSALGSDGWVYSFGSTFGYRFGNGGSTTVTDSTKLSRLAQGAIPLATKLVDVSVGGNVSCAVGDDGSAYCWGNGYFGSLGDGDLTEHTVLVATKVLQGEIPNGVKIMSVRCGTYHCTAYANDKKFYAWGFAEGAAIGQPNGTSNSTASPKLISRVSQN